MSFAIPAGAHVLFTGDSITDAGRRTTAVPLGSGYVKFVHDLIIAKYPAHKVRITNTGISGHNVRELAERWTDDVINYRPDWLSIMIGINDIHRWLNNVEGRIVTPEQYATLYRGILERTRDELDVKLVLIEPFYISRETNPNSFRCKVLQHLPEYQQTAESLAKEFGAYYVRFHAMFQKRLEHYPPDEFCPEPVHPNPTGHLLMAHEWLRVLETG